MRITLFGFLLLVLVLPAWAGVTCLTFDFNCLKAGDGGAQIDKYMSDVYGGKVNTKNACIADGKFTGTPYVETVNSKKNIDIRFNKDITACKFTGDTGLIKADKVKITAYDGDKCILRRTINLKSRNYSRWLHFKQPVDTIRFTTKNACFRIDDLSIETCRKPAPGHGDDDGDDGGNNGGGNRVPAPGALLLGSLGVMLTGWLRRFKS